MHHNSLEAYRNVKDEMDKRESMIYNFLFTSGKTLTDREITEALGFKERGSVQPRITMLVQNLWLREVGKVPCHITGKKVRKVRALSSEERKTLLDMIRKDAVQGDLFKEAA